MQTLGKGKAKTETYISRKKITHEGSSKRGERLTDRENFAVECSVEWCRHREEEETISKAMSQNTEEGKRLIVSSSPLTWTKGCLSPREERNLSWRLC